MLADTPPSPLAADAAHLRAITAGLPSLRRTHVYRAPLQRLKWLALNKPPTPTETPACA